MVCSLCSGRMTALHTGTILGSCRVVYFECQECGFLRTEDPYWLDKAYSSAIAALDTGAISRNVDCARELSRLLPIAFGRTGPFLDFAGGHGVLTRLMRDYGLDFYWSDAYAENHYAQGFEWDPRRGPVTAATAIEVLEHVTEPVELLSEIIRISGASTVLFTTVLRPRTFDPEWWYLTPATGQHVGFHTSSSLAALAARVDMVYQRVGRWHLIARQPLPAARLAAAVVAMSPALIPRLARARRTLAQRDHLVNLGRLEGNAGSLPLDDTQ